MGGTFGKLIGLGATGAATAFGGPIAGAVAGGLTGLAKTGSLSQGALGAGMGYLGGRGNAATSSGANAASGAANPLDLGALAAGQSTNYLPGLQALNKMNTTPVSLPNLPPMLKYLMDLNNQKA